MIELVVAVLWAVAALACVVTSEKPKLYNVAAVSMILLCLLLLVIPIIHAGG